MHSLYVVACFFILKLLYIYIFFLIIYVELLSKTGGNTKKKCNSNFFENFITFYTKVVFIVVFSLFLLVDILNMSLFK